MLVGTGALVLLSVAVQAQEGAKPKFLPPVRGEALLGYTVPATKRAGGEIVTTIKVKNMSTTNNVVGLKVEEFWYDKKGDPVTGGEYRHRKPLGPGEMLDVVIHTPTNPGMDRNSYKFSHANGTVKTGRMDGKTGELLSAKAPARKKS
jgi:hypothetical protein